MSSPTWSSSKQVCLDGEHWMPFDDYAQAILRSAKGAGLPRSEVTSVGRRYEAWLLDASLSGEYSGS